MYLLTQPANTSLKDYGRFQKDGELKVLSHMDSRVRNRCVLSVVVQAYDLLVVPFVLWVLVREDFIVVCSCF